MGSNSRSTLLLVSVTGHFANDGIMSDFSTALGPFPANFYCVCHRYHCLYGKTFIIVALIKKAFKKFMEKPNINSEK